jgi:hypothetical protein
MSEEGFALTPLGQSVYFAYIEAYAKKHNISNDEAIIRLSKEAMND